MTLRDIYEFYDKYFNYEKGITCLDNKQLYLAIRDTMRVLMKIIEVGSFRPIDNYSIKKEVNTLALKYLMNLKKLMLLHYRQPLKELEFSRVFIKIHKGELNTRRRGIKIPLVYWFDCEKAEIKFMCFSNSTNMLKELEVFKSLIADYTIDKAFPEGIKRVTYWDLNSGKESSLNYISIKKASKRDTLAVANEI